MTYPCPLCHNRASEQVASADKNDWREARKAAALVSRTTYPHPLLRAVHLSLAHGWKLP